MKVLDTYLQTVRISKAKRFIRKGDTVLDIGSVDGVLFEHLRGFIARGFGIDPVLKQEIKRDFYTLIPGYFPHASPQGVTFDVITLLAVLEHVPPEVQKILEEQCRRLLCEKGRVIITVPSPKIDVILDRMIRLKLADGMSIEEHYGFRPEQTEKIFTNGFKMLHHSTFQIGLNNLFVFEKI